MENKSGSRKNKVVLKILLISFVVVGLLIVWQGIPLVQAATECKAVDGYQLATNRFAQDLSGNPVLIVRAVFSTGEAISGISKKIILPVCSSKDENIESIRNMFLILDGQQIFVASGAIVRENQQVPLTETPQQ